MQRTSGTTPSPSSSFFGTMEECLEDCCEVIGTLFFILLAVFDFLIELPETGWWGWMNVTERGGWKLHTGKDLVNLFFYLSKVSILNLCITRFIEENPGCQTAAHDRSAAQNLIHEGIDVNQRDNVGRTTLQGSWNCMWPYRRMAWGPLRLLLPHTWTSSNFFLTLCTSHSFRLVTAT